MIIDIKNPEHKKAYEYFQVSGHPLMSVNGNQPDDVDNQVHYIVSILCSKNKKYKHMQSYCNDEAVPNGSEWETQPDINQTEFGIHAYWLEAEALITCGKYELKFIDGDCVLCVNEEDFDLVEFQEY